MDAERALRTLLELTARLTEDVPLETFLQAVTDATLDLVGADHASVRLLDAQGEQLLSGARSGAGAHDRPMGFQRGQGLIGWVAERGEPLVVDDVATDPRFTSPGGQGFPMRSYAGEPLWSGGRVIGVLSATSTRASAFGEGDRLLLRLLANCSAPPIERARLERLANVDELTMAMSQRLTLPLLASAMDEARASGTDLSVLYLDLDHFKRVNDERGHAIGDRVLATFADRVRAHVRRDDVLVRRGGEEFLLVMPRTSDAQAGSTAERIRAAIAQHPFAFPGQPPLVQTVSIGVATWDGHESAGELEARADAAMYEAKRSGRNRVSAVPPPEPSSQGSS